MRPEDAPQHYQAYHWNSKHSLYGYPPDDFPRFTWIASLEQRFGWLRGELRRCKPKPVFLIEEMIQWGGSQNGTLQKFREGIGEVNFGKMLEEVLDHLDNPELAISAALDLPGLGLTYASKLLRFLDPDQYGALDGQLRRALPDLPRIHDGHRNSMVQGFVAFANTLQNLQNSLKASGVVRPQSELKFGSVAGWRAADVEMALFRWSTAHPTEFERIV